jgi:copper chaperone CopZ
VKGVKDAKVNVDKKKATIRFDSELVDEGTLKKAKTKAGYRVAEQKFGVLPTRLTQ